MTEGLARQLRLCGIDARSAPLATGRQRYQAYLELAGIASSEQRIVLTADTVFLRARCAPLPCCVLALSITAFSC